MFQRQPLLIIVSGPAGSGKTTLCERLCANVPTVKRVVTSTTRAPRPGEQHGIDYYFFDRESFEQKICAGDFYEYARVHTNIYGTLKSEIADKFALGHDLLLNIDVQGAASFRASAATDPQLRNRLITVFVAATDEAELRNRLGNRGTDDAAEIDRRMQSARKEMLEWPHYDYLIESRSRDEDFQSLVHLYEAEKRRALRLTLKP